MSWCVSYRPFNHELYEDEGEDDDILDEEGRARLKLKVWLYYSSYMYMHVCMHACGCACCCSCVWHVSGIV